MGLLDLTTFLRQEQYISWTHQIITYSNTINLLVQILKCTYSIFIPSLRSRRASSSVLPLGCCQWVPLCMWTFLSSHRFIHFTSIMWFTKKYLALASLYPYRDCKSIWCVLIFRVKMYFLGFAPTHQGFDRGQGMLHFSRCLKYMGRI